MNKAACWSDSSFQKKIHPNNMERNTGAAIQGRRWSG